MRELLFQPVACSTQMNKKQCPSRISRSGAWPATEQVFKQILGNCQSVVNYLETLRNAWVIHTVTAEDQFVLALGTRNWWSTSPELWLLV
jgi:hypothetical protein